ncbi:MAG: class I tRNA ligase family protein, partial [Thermoguttaceae bacterium]
QGYREVADPSVFVRFPLIRSDERVQGSEFRVQEFSREPEASALRIEGEGQGEGLSDIDLLVWTTTPWTLPGNQFAAVKPDLQYALVSVEGESRKLLLAEALVETIAAKVGKEFIIISTMPGEKLIGLRYRPPYDYYYKSLGEVQGRLLDGQMQHLSWRVVPAEFVTVDTGTGVVHQAPAFGEVDFDLLRDERTRFVNSEGPDLICPVAPDGTFTAEASDYQGRWVKDCDRDIIRELKAKRLLFHQEQYLHDYPFCWRAEEDPLIQYPRRSWFIRTTKFKEAMLANNSLINWLPEHIRDGRFGNFLETNVDWALSRERYWGTPLPIWVCEKTGYAEAVAGYDELLAKPGLSGIEVWEKAKRENPDLPDDLKVHKPYIDAVTYDSPKAPGARMRRVPEVIDCWFDSGAMPFAQWGYPHQPGSEEKFNGQFPADFISEALDQTRGWFYSLLAISTLLFGKNGEQETVPPSPPAPLPKGEGTKTILPKGEERKNTGSSSLIPNPQSLIPTPYPHPFRNCIVLGFILGEDGGKMSKSKRNFREPNEIFNRYGADAMRWYFFSNQPPWTSIRYSEQAIKDCIPEFLLRLWNVYSFFVIYAKIDKFDPASAFTGRAGQLTADILAGGKGFRPLENRSELDRWIIGELNRTVATVTERMDAYDNFAACAVLSEFVDALSNWYVRRSRDRFWSGEQSADKADAYWTLYECLLTTCKLIAPFVPFLAEEMWQNLAVAAFSGAGVSPASAAGTAAPQAAVESVHLCDYPTAASETIDELLSQRMALVREIVSLGRSARMGAKLKVRQPLSQVEIVLADNAHQSWLQEHAALICDELNVKRIEFAVNADQYINYTILPDLKRLGPRLGKRLPALKKILAGIDGGNLLAEMESRGKITISLEDGPIALDADDIQVRLQAKPGWAAAHGKMCVVVLATELTPELIAEGLSKDLVRVIQDRRKEMGLEFTDRIVVGLVTDSDELTEAVKQFGGYIQGETLALEISSALLPGVEAVEVKVGDYTATLYVKKA